VVGFASIDHQSLLQKVQLGVIEVAVPEGPDLVSAVGEYDHQQNGYGVGYNCERE
jgi:hypothetical protein